MMIYKGEANVKNIRLCNNLESLSLTKIKEYLPAYLDGKINSKMSTVDILLDLTDKEVDFREKRAAGN